MASFEPRCLGGIRLAETVQEQPSTGLLPLPSGAAVVHSAAVAAFFG